jgi:hypothetical protein
MVPAELCPALLCRWVPGSVASLLSQAATPVASPTGTTSTPSAPGSALKALALELELELARGAPRASTLGSRQFARARGDF